MSRGFNISAGAHGLLALWLLLGPVFRPDPPEMTVADVSVISEAEFAALTAPQEGPQTEPAPAAPEAPEETPAPPPPPSDTRPPARPEPPAPTPDAQPDTQPAEPPAPVPPVAEVQDAPPDPLPAPPAAPEVAAPESELPPTPRDAPRVAPEAVAPPPPEAVPDETVQQAADPEAESPDIAEAEQESTAPEEATTEIVTEAERPAAAPNASVRPLARPERQVAAVQPEPEPEPEPAPEPEPEPEAEPEPASAPEPEPEPEPEPAPQEVPSDDIAAALAEAMSGGQGTDPAPQAPAGPPLTPGEREGLRLAVQRCWVVDVGSQAASVTVVVGFDLQPDGRPVEGSVRLLDSTGGSGAAAEAAYSAARRAILRCAAEQNGFDLPSDKYDQWKTVEMTFNPEQMRTR